MPGGLLKKRHKRRPLIEGEKTHWRGGLSSRGIRDEDADIPLATAQE